MVGNRVQNQSELLKKVKRINQRGTIGGPHDYRLLHTCVCVGGAVCVWRGAVCSRVCGGGGLHGFGRGQMSVVVFFLKPAIFAFRSCLQDARVVFNRFH